MKYPPSALRNQLSGTVRIAFTIASDGTVSNYRVARPIDAVLDEESLRVIKLLPATWVPAEGQPVAAEGEVPVCFFIE